MDPTYQYITKTTDKILEDYQEKANPSNFPPARIVCVIGLFFSILLLEKVLLALDMHNFNVFLQINLI